MSNITNNSIDKILDIQKPNFSQNSIVKVDIEKQVERTVNNSSSNSSSTVLDNNSSLK